MKKPSLLITFLIVTIVSNLIAVGTFGNTNTPFTSGQPSNFYTIADTNSNNSLANTHQVLTRLPNGTLCATFSTNLLAGINNYEVYVATSNDNGTTWGTPTQISNATGMDSYLSYQGIYGCSIAADANGQLYVAWTGVNDSSTYYQVWCAQYNGSAWATPVQVSQGASLGVQASYTSIAVDGANTVHLVWDAYFNGSSHTNIFHSNFNGTGTWSSPIAISTQTNSSRFNQLTPDIAVDGNNDLHVVWQGQNEIWYANYRNESWQTPIILSNQTILDNAPCIAIAPNGVLHVAWSGACDSVSIYSQIWYVRNNGTWSLPQRISNTNDMNCSIQTYPTIAVNAYNQVYIAWMNEGAHALFYVNDTAPWATPMQLEPTNSAFAHYRSSYYPLNTNTSNPEFVYLTGSVLMFGNDLSTQPFFGSVIANPQQVTLSESVNLTVNVLGGVSPYTYQWFNYNTPILGANSSTCIYTPPVSGINPICVNVTDYVGTTIQCYYNLTVSSLSGSIFAYPEQVTLGQSVNLTAYIAQNISPTYQWFIDNIPVSGVNCSTWIYTPQTSGVQSVYVNVTELGETVQFAALNITVLPNEEPTPSPTPTPTPTETPTPTPTPTETPTPTSTATPTTTPTPAPTATPTPTPTPTPTSLAVSTLAVSCVSNITENSFIISIAGNLTSNSTAIPYAPVFISYNVNGSNSWQNITTVNTAQDGHFHVQWLPTATGEYCIKVEYLGNSNCSATFTTVNLVITNFSSTVNASSVFSVSSNSTVSTLVFNSTSQELSFTVSGANGTSGCTSIVISKQLVSDPTAITAYLDGAAINYTVTSTEDDWILQFTYHHSTHSIVLHMNEAASSSASLQSPDIRPVTAGTTQNVLVLVLAILISCIAVAVIVKRKRR